GGDSTIGLEGDPRGPSVRHGLLPSFSEERGHASGSRPKLEAVAAASDRRKREDGYRRNYRDDDDELEQGDPTRAARSLAHWDFPPMSQLVTSEASPSPPGAPSEPNEERSYSPCSPGLRYWYGLPHGSRGTSFLRYGPSQPAALPGLCWRACRPSWLVG